MIAVKTMSSLEISELTGKEHKNVLADIRKMLIELHGDGGELNFKRSYLSEQNKELPLFNLDREIACLKLMEKQTSRQPLRS
jgi:Rha family phage regulatory protein